MHVLGIPNNKLKKQRILRNRQHKHKQESKSQANQIHFCQLLPQNFCTDSKQVGGGGGGIEWVHEEARGAGVVKDHI